MHVKISFTTISEINLSHVPYLYVFICLFVSSFHIKGSYIYVTNDKDLKAIIYPIWVGTQHKNMLIFIRVALRPSVYTPRCVSQIHNPMEDLDRFMKCRSNFTSSFIISYTT